MYHDRLYVAADNLIVFDVRQAAKPRQLARLVLPSAHGLAISNGRLYVADQYEGVRVIDRDAPAAAANYGGWVNPVYDQLIDDASRTPDKEERKRLYVEAEKLIHEEAPKVRSISAYNLSAWRKAVRGYRPNLAGNMTYNASGFRNTWLAQS